MRPTLTTRGRSPWITWGLLLLQFVAAGPAGFAHARERLDAPVRVESTRHERCPVVHDPSSCAMCSYVHARAIVAPGPVWVAPIAHPRVASTPAVATGYVRPQELTAAPRGPPAPPA